MNKSTDKCPSCGSFDLKLTTFTHTITGGRNAALVDVQVECCLACGEILFTPEQVTRFEEIKIKLENEQVDNFIPLGKSYRFIL